jgi:riboflavin kinase/FMN adenylyltransferase
LIYSLSQRLEVMAALALDVVWVIHFDRPFSQQKGQDFVTALVRDFGGIESISIGENFTFGHRRSGNVALLEQLGRALGFAVHALPAVQWGGQPISSTRIRESIQAGQLEAVSEMLGRPYSLGGVVQRGDELGRQLGFATANLSVAGLVLPPTGVYAGWACLEKQSWPAVMNLGFRPTLARPEPELRVEVHILDFRGDLYGKELQFQTSQRLRSERKFSSVEALKTQIGQDIERARVVLQTSEGMPGRRSG